MHREHSMNKLLVLVLAMGVSMFSFGKNKSVIEVKFYEGKSETPFAASNVPIENLPDSFEINTTMHLGDDDWIVLEAEPAEKSEFRKTGRLNLYMAKNEITQINPNELLYSLPTINNDIAGVEHASSLENIAVLREDDWRQFEFLDQRNESIVNQEFIAIENIYKNYREGVGFKQLHLRQKIEAPLQDVKLTLNMLEASFDIVHVYEGVAFNNAAATIVGGFAMQTKDGWLLWGQVNESGQVSALNISQTKDSSIDQIADKVDTFTEKYGLYLINWPRLFWCGPEKLKFIAYSE